MQLKQLIKEVLMELDQKFAWDGRFNNLGRIKRTIRENNVKKTKYSVDDLPTGSIIHFKDGESWIVVKSDMRASNNRKQSNEVTVKPYNIIAKNNNVSLAIDLDIDYINQNVTKVKSPK